MILTALVLGLGLATEGMRAASASDITPEKVIELTNQDRAKEGLPALVANDKLAQAAQMKADDMAQREYFAHTSPSGVTPWHWIEKSGYSYRYAGENLAIRFTDAEEEQKAWMDSPKHRENILSDKYGEIGVAVKTVSMKDEAPAIVTVQLFGTRVGQVLPETAPQAKKPADIGEVEAKTVGQALVGREQGAFGKGMAERITETLVLALVVLLGATGSVSVALCGRILAEEAARKWHFAK
jgi:hypothetical protein